MTHAEHIAELERAVVEAAVDMWRSGKPLRWSEHRYLKAGPQLNSAARDCGALFRAVHALIAARAATCPTCGGSGLDPRYNPALGDFASGGK